MIGKTSITALMVFPSVSSGRPRPDDGGHTIGKTRCRGRLHCAPMSAAAARKCANDSLPLDDHADLERSFLFALASIFFFSDFDSLPFLTICAARAFALAA